MNDLISRRDVIWSIKRISKVYDADYINKDLLISVIEEYPSAQPEIIHCIDCKFYTPMNRETKTGICNLTMHQNFGDKWYCAGAERREYEEEGGEE